MQGLIARPHTSGERDNSFKRVPKLRAAIATAGVAAALLAVPVGTAASEASWTGSEVTAGLLTAVTIAPPVITDCTLSSVAGVNPVITVTWKFPVGSGYGIPANVNYYVASGAKLSNLTPVTPGSSLTTTGPANGAYTTQFKSALLSGLLGGTYGVYLQSKDGSGWVSTLAGANASMGLAGINPVCTVQ
ncbi:hypothetical protein [Arthrobacter sp. NA-172]|uniref:hypothetical protein n=1 Tax=Arthrobacter sp. NA-172 TaxID=3367524 RepID=UPI0037545424